VAGVGERTGEGRESMVDESHFGKGGRERCGVRYLSSGLFAGEDREGPYPWEIEGVS